MSSAEGSNPYGQDAFYTKDSGGGALQAFGFVDCILEGKEPLVGVEWGLHITEMMAGALVSSQTGRRYDMTTTLEY